MSSILKGPGWATREVITEKIKIGDVEKVLPGWGPGKEAKKHFQGKIGDEVPTGRHGTLRKVATTSYREAELAFSRFLADAMGIAENVIATKEVKSILRDITGDQLAEHGFDSVDSFIDAWVEYAHQKFGLELTNLATKRAVGQIAKEIKDEVPELPDDEADIEMPDLGGEQPVVAAAPANNDHALTPDVVNQLANNPAKFQNAETSDDKQTFTEISFLSQQEAKIVYIRFNNVPSNPQTRQVLRGLQTGKTVGDILNAGEIKPYLTEVEVEQNGRSIKYKPQAAEVPNPQPQGPNGPQDNQAADFDFKMESVRLSPRQRTIVAEQVRTSKLRHMQRIEERYHW